MIDAVKMSITLLMLIPLSNCATTQTCEPYAIFDYEDFGPQASAHQLLGMQWWQWQDHGESDPSTQYNIKVVVHQAALTKRIKREFPVAPTKQLDYRYVTFENAHAYLNQHIDEDRLPTLTDKLKKTRAKLGNAESCNN